MTYLDQYVTSRDLGMKSNIDLMLQSHSAFVSTHFDEETRWCQIIPLAFLVQKIFAFLHKTAILTFLDRPNHRC